MTDGRVFESTRDFEPLQIKLGAGQAINNFEQEIEGMSPGETKHFELPAEKAFGLPQKDRMLTFPLSDLPAYANPKVGQKIEVQMNDGKLQEAVITDVSEATLAVDTNHPLAGEDLEFDLELLEIV